MEPRLMMDGAILELATLANDGSQANDFTFDMDMSATGRFVVFTSQATNLVPGDTNNHQDIFVFDRQSKTVERVSVGAGGVEANGSSNQASITSDGRYVAFHSFASNLVAGDTNDKDDVFVFDRETDTITLVSRALGSASPGNGQSFNADIAANGRYVAFASAASNLIGGDTNDTTDIFVFDLQTNAMERVNVTSSGGQTVGHTVGNPPSPAPYDSNDPSISDDGRYVAFDTQAENLGSDGNNFRDVYVRDRTMNKTEKISVGDTTLGNQGSFFPGISGDGNFVAFSSRASNLAGATGSQTQVLLRDRVAKTTTMISVGPGGVPGGGSSNSFPSVSFDGRYTVYTSRATNLVASDTNGNEDAFLYDRTTGTNSIANLTADGMQGNSYTDEAIISADGRIVGFLTNATNFVAGDANGERDIVVRSPDARFIVNSTADEPDSNVGDGLPFTSRMVSVNGQMVPEVTLRSAIMEANGDANADEIIFNIASSDMGFDAASDAFVIRPATPLPAISRQVKIDGYTQSGAKKATASATAELKIQLNGVLLPAGLTARGLEITADLATIQGLNIVRFDSSGIVIRGDSNDVFGNFIGVGPKGTATLDAQGRTNLGNGFGIRIIEGVFNEIGGRDDAERNVISGNELDGIRVELGTSSINRIRNNIIGLNAAETMGIGNGGDGVVIDNAITTEVGGVEADQGNIISGNFGAGVRIIGSAARNNLVQGNTIGIDLVTDPLVGNVAGGVIVQNSSDNTIGSTITGGANFIAGNGHNGFAGNATAPGVHIISGERNAIIGNEIIGNAGLGIDLGPLGVTRNQDDPTNLPAAQAAMTGNGLANFPVLTIDAAGAIRTVLESAPSTRYRIEYFTTTDFDPSGHGEGQSFLGSVEVMTDAMGRVDTMAAGITAPPDTFITATATKVLGGAPLQATSEFSQTVKRGSNPSVTIVTHGYVLQVGDGDTIRPVAEAIVNRTGGNLVDYTISGQGGQGAFTTPVAAGKHNVVLFDWATESNETSPGWAEAAADALLALLVRQGLVNPATGAANGNIHFVAHSFGAALTSDVIERLAAYGVPVDHLTYLDPHDFDETAIPVDESQREFDIGLPQFGTDRGLNYGATVWNNVTYADAYFQTRSIGGGPNFIFPEGRPILGAYNYFLDTELPDASGVFAPYSASDSDHSWVWNVWYRGTVEGNGGRTTGAAPEIMAPHYSAEGYAYSRALGGVGRRPAPVFPNGPIGADGSPNKWTHRLLNFSNPALKQAPLWDPHTIINGDFEAPGTQFTGNLVDIVPGWSHHGGGGDGDIEPDRDEDSSENHYLELDFDIASAGHIRTHNYMYVPHVFQNLFLEFDLWRTDASSDDQLRVYFDDGAGNRTDIATIALDATDAGFVRQSFAVPANLKGTSRRLTFEIVNNGLAVDSVVRIDNVRWGDSNTGISGTKFEDTNGNGLKEASEGPPTELFTIFADLNGNGSREGNEPSTMTRADGTWLLGVAPGQYTLREEGKPGWSQTTPNPMPITVGANGVVAGPSFGNFKQMRIAGFKFEDKNGNGVKDTGEVGLQGWTITLYNDKAQKIAERTTDADGKYEFTNLDPVSPASKTDFYIIEEGQRDGWTQTLSPDAMIPIESGFDRSDMDFGNFEQMSITGHKFVDSNGNGVHDAGEPGAAGWEIVLEFNGVPIASTMTDAGGRYEFNDVGDNAAQLAAANGMFRITEVLKPGWIAIATPAAAPIMSGMAYVDMDLLNFELMTVRGVKFEDDDGDGVFDDDEDGLAGVTIEVDIDNDGVADYTTITAADGSYEIKDIEPRDDGTTGDFVVREVVPPGWTATTPPGGEYTHAIASGAKHLSDDFGNFELMTIAGIKFDDLDGDGVRDSGEPGLAGWTIELDLGDGSPVRTDVTGADGIYLFENVPPRGNGTAGSFTLRERQQAGYTVVAPSTGQYSIPIRSGYDNDELDFANFENVTLTGVKFADLNNDGTRQDNEPGLKGWTIQLDLNNNGSTDRTAVTDVDGRYAFNDVPQGTHKLTEVAQTGWQQTRPAPGSPDLGANVIAARSGQSRGDLDFGNRNLVAVLAGTKFNDLDRDGLRDIGEGGLGGWLIYLDANNDGILNNSNPANHNKLDANTLEPATLTDDKGNYVFVITTGTYVVREVQQLGWEQSFPANGFHAVNVPNPPQSFAPLDFGNFELRAIGGVKFDDLDGDGVRDAGEPGIAGWNVELRNAAGAVVDQMMTDATGAYLFRGMAPGFYTVTEEQRAGFTQTRPGPAGYPLADLTLPVRVSNIDFGNFADMTIAGVKFHDLDGDGVRDGNEPGLAGFTIELDLDQDGAADFTTTTAADGSYSFTGIGPRATPASGRFTLHEVPRAGYAQTLPANDGDYEIDIRSGLVTNDRHFGNFQLAVVRGVAFKDKDQDGTQDPGEGGAKDFVIYLDADNDGTLDAGETSVTTNSDGEYEFANLPLGAYRIRQVDRANYIPTSPAGGVHLVNITTGGQVVIDRDFGDFLTGVELAIGDNAFTSVKIIDGNKTQTVSLAKGNGTMRITGDITDTDESGAAATVTGDGIEIAEINIEQSSLATALKFAVKGGDGIMAVGDILVAGSIGSIAGKVDVLGDVIIAGTAKTLTFNDVADDHLISIGPVSSSKDAVTIVLHDVRETDILSQTPIKSLTVARWLDEDGDADTITAPWIGTLSVKGDAKLAMAGDFAADLDLAGDPAAKVTLNSAAVAGTIEGSQWTVPGDAGAIKFASWLGGGYTGGSVKSFTAAGDKKNGTSGDVNIDLTLTGSADLKKPALGAVKLAGDLVAGEWNVNGNGAGISVNSVSPLWIAGFTGDLKSLAANADLAGRITARSFAAVSAKRDAIDLQLLATLPPAPDNARALGIGKFTVAGVLASSQVRAAGGVGSVAVGVMLDSTFLVGVNDNLNEIPDAVGDFSTTPALMSFTVKGLPNFAVAFINSHVAAWDIGTITIALPQTFNGGSAFGVAAHSIKKLTVKDPAIGFTETNRAPVIATVPPIDDLEFRLV